MFLAVVPEVAAVGAEVGAEVGAAVAVEASEVGAGTAGEVGSSLARTMAGDLGSSASDVAGSGSRTPGGFTQVLARDAVNDAIGDREALAGDSAGSQSSNSLSRITDSDNASFGNGESGGNGGAQSLLDGGDDLARFTQPSDQAEQDQEIERRNSRISPATGKPVEEQYKLSGREEGDGAARDAQDHEDANIPGVQDAADSRARIVSGDSDPASSDLIREKSAGELRNMADAILQNSRNDAQQEAAHLSARAEAEASQARAARETAEAQRIEARPTQAGLAENIQRVHEEPETRASQTEPAKPSTELELYKRPVEDREATEPRLPAVRAEQAEIVEREIIRDDEHLGRSEQQSLRDQERARAMEAIEDAEIIEEVELLDEIEMRMEDREAEARARREEEQQARQARMAEEQQQQEILDLSQGEIISEEQWQEIQQQRLQQEQWEREREQEVQAIIEQEQMRLRAQSARDGYVQSEVDGLDQELRDFLNNPENAGPARPEPRLVGDNGPDAAQPAPRGEGGDDGARGEEELVGAAAGRGSTAMPNSSFFGVETIRGNALNQLGNLRRQTLYTGEASGQTTNTATGHSRIRNFMKNIGTQSMLMGLQGMQSNIGENGQIADQGA